MRPTPFKPRGFWSTLLVGLCVVLVVMVGAIHAAHFHRDGRIDPDCALCVTAHCAPNVVPVIALHFTSQAIATVVLARRIHMPRAEVFIRLFSRPPPADSAILA